jgi:hypothetical protein
MTGMTGVEVDYLKHHVSKKMGLPVWKENCTLWK